MRLSRILPLLALGLLAACKEDAPPRVAGDAAPEIAVLDLAGKTVSLADFKGRPVVLSFWFTGCGPCSAELPVLDAFAADPRGRRAAILAVNMIDAPDVIRATARRLGVGMPLYADSLEITTKRYGVTGAPANFILDASGRVAHRIDGPLDRAALERLVLPLIGS